MVMLRWLQHYRRIQGNTECKQVAITAVAAPYNMRACKRKLSSDMYDLLLLPLLFFVSLLLKMMSKKS